MSRVVSRLKERFEEWQNRALSEEVYAIVYLNGFHLKVRMAKRVISVPVLPALGGRCAPQKVDPALIARFRPATIGCSVPVDPSVPPAS